ncbi:MAG: Ig-like domain-containing protein [Longimicrobiales bacterium]
MRFRFGLMALALCVAACARPLPPPGGEEDRSPPQIVATEPEPLAVLPDFNGPVVFRFDERLTEQNVETSILVSPATSEARADHDGSAVRVELEGGWRPGIVYRVVLLPGIGDLFGNQRQTPAELVFSTGPEIPETALAGIVLERITGRPARDVIIEAAPRDSTSASRGDSLAVQRSDSSAPPSDSSAAARGDSIVYLTTADTAAFFALRHLPVGGYDVRAYVDENDNRRHDPSEAIAAAQPVTFEGPRDTIALVLTVIPPDTTPAEITRAEVRDSTQIRVTVDDYIDPDIPLDVQAMLFTLPDTTPFAGAHHIMSPDSFDTLRRALGDTIGPPVDTLAQIRPELEPATPVVEPIGPLPFREIVLVPGSPLPPETSFLLRVEGLINIAGLTGGGGEVEFETPARRAPPDTTTIPIDTTTVRIDTTAVPVDTTAVPRRR